MMRISIGILSFAAFSVLAGCAKTQKAGPEPVPVVAEIVATQQVQPSWTYSGEIRPDTEVQLAFKEPGYIDALYRVKGVDGRMRDVQVGDEIRATLARLHSDYKPR
jgi:multidrug efflux pump subunit AcrA (membrane-fusion protein)